MESSYWRHSFSEHEKSEMAVENKTRISKLLEQSSPVIFGPELMKELGRAPAIFLQKLHYWLITEGDHIGHFIDGRRWIYNTYEDWAKSLGIYCSTTIARAVRKLEKLGIISTRKFRSRKGDHQKAYTINYDVLNTLLPWLTQETSDVDISKKGESHQDQDTPQENSQIEKEQNVLFIYGKHRCTKIISITSGEEVSKKPVKQPPVKSPRKEKINKPEIKESKLTEANQTIYKLVEIYQKQIGEKVVLNKRLGQWLMAAFQKLGSCLKKWENFCKRIATSDWLMGRFTNGFKATLSWLLRFEIMDRILGGDFRCKEPYEEPSLPTQEDEQQLIQQIEASDLSAEEQSVKKTLLKTFGIARFKSYFAQAKIRLEHGNVNILVKGLFYRDQIDMPSIWGKILALYPNAILGVEG